MGKVIVFDDRPLATSGIRSTIVTDTYIAEFYQYIMYRKLTIEGDISIVIDGELVIL